MIKFKFQPLLFLCSTIFIILLIYAPANLAASLKTSKDLNTGKHLKTKIDLTEEIKIYKYKKITKALHYGNEFHGLKTASGDLYDKNKFTAASKNLPFGTKVLVKNPQNGKFCFVTINDRGPFEKGYGLDLSQATYKSLGLKGSHLVVCYTKKPYKYHTHTKK